MSKSIKNRLLQYILQNYFSRPQPGLLRTHGLEGALSSRVPERVVPQRGEQIPVDMSPTKATPHLRATCNANTYNHTHSSTYTLLYLNVYMSWMQYAPHDSNPKSSLTPSHAYAKCEKRSRASPNAYLFPYQVLCVMHLRATYFRVFIAGRSMSRAYTTFFTGFHRRVNV